MKKEIEVFISDYFERNGFGNIQTIDQGSFNNSIKATLIIEMPEKKIEITESEFDQQWVSLDVLTTDQADMFIRLKEKLFGN